MSFLTNTYFRFRPYSPISLKEIQYGEIFFAHKDDLNDPYDTKNSSFYKGDYIIYKRLLEFIIKENFNFLNIPKVNLDKICFFLASQDLFYDHLLEKIESSEFKNLVLNTFLIPESVSFSELFIKRIKYFFYKYSGGSCYIASFSKECDNPIMWSHYSHYHTGYCLCFKLNDNKIKAIPNSNNSLLNEFILEPVSYKKSTIKTNGFYTFPGAVLGKSISETERLKYWMQKRKSFLIKSESWSYEKEFRVIQYDWLTDKISDLGVDKRSIDKRIFYYDQRQLNGIIFGSKMSKQNKEEIENIILSIRSKQLLKFGYLEIFVFYKSVEKQSADYKMEIIPISGLDMFNNYFEISDLKKKENELEKYQESSKKI